MKLELKIAKAEKKTLEASLEDQKAFDAKVFKTGRFSELQKYLVAIKKTLSLPPKIILGDEIAKTDEEISSLLNEFFINVFHPMGSAALLRPSDKLTCNRAEVDEHKIRELLQGTWEQRNRLAQMDWVISFLNLSTRP